MAVPQKIVQHQKTALLSLAESGSKEAATHLREHLASPALAHFSVSVLTSSLLQSACEHAEFVPWETLRGYHFPGAILAMRAVITLQMLASY